jgi:hypothetical protein
VLAIRSPVPTILGAQFPRSRGPHFGALLLRAAALHGQQQWWRAYFAAALDLPTLPDGLLAEAVPTTPAAFAAVAKRYGVDPFILLWLVKDHMRG